MQIESVIRAVPPVALLEERVEIKIHIAKFVSFVLCPLILARIPSVQLASIQSTM